MLFYEGPRDIAKHMQELEQRFELSGYDHSNQNITGWRREMAEARVKKSAVNLTDDGTTPGALSRLVSVVGAWLRPGVFSTE